MDFGASLRREIHESDVLRTRIMALLSTVGAATSVVVLAIMAVSNRSPTSGRTAATVAMISFCVLALYETGYGAWLKGRWRSREVTVERWQNLNLIFEVSVPTIAMALVAPALSSPSLTLVSPLFLTYFVFIGLSTLHLRVRSCAIAAVTAAVQYAMLGWLVVRIGEPSLASTLVSSPVVHGARVSAILMAGAAAGFVAAELRKRIQATFEEAARHTEVLQVFGQHTSPEVVATLLDNDRGGSVRTEATVLFFDIRGFTSFAEKRDPADVVAVLECVFDHVIRAVNENGGIVHQLLGDGVMAIFGVPVSRGNDAANAIAAACDISRSLEVLRFDNDAPIRFGIGLHTGLVVAGTVGSAIHREYTVTGDTVNLAARLEQLTKRYEGPILASGTVIQRAGSVKATVEFLGDVPIRGRAEEVALYSVSVPRDVGE